jgi:PBP1b-binding outer membrane lipoprotein LpoB
MGVNVKQVAMAAVAAAVALAGCGPSKEDLRPDVNAIVVGDRGPQSRDLNEMAAQMAPDLLANPIVKANTPPVYIVMMDMANRMDTDPLRNMDIYLAKLTSLLNTNVTADRVQFVERPATLQGLQAQALGAVDPATFGLRQRPQYALYGEVYSMNNGATTYYLFTFHLTDVVKGTQVWNKSYDVRTLNY